MRTPIGETIPRVFPASFLAARSVDTGNVDLCADGCEREFTAARARRLRRKL
ncbi:MAG: hypothetical protein M3N41_02210 [Acidobacteriota bacterium]|nr:hypothetical protein [Acidobacteriota bacterium]